MIQKQQTMIFSPYMDLYNLIVPEDNLLRRINSLVDFSFVYEELKDKYCLDNGRNAIDPIRMFKYLLLKTIYDLSDVDVVDRSKYDMSFKYFLNMAPEEEVIEPSTLTKFRKLRLKDVNLLDMLINKTVEIAIEKEIIKSKSIIADATHTKARYNQMTPKEVLMERSKKLRKAVYQIDESGVVISVWWSNTVLYPNDYDLKILGPDAAKYWINNECGRGNVATNMRYEIYPL